MKKNQNKYMLKGSVSDSEEASFNSGFLPGPKFTGEKDYGQGNQDLDK
jgi:hypothetical protein